MRSVAELMPREDGRLLVIMDAMAPESVGELAGRLRSVVPRRWQSVRLVAPNAAADPDDCPARELSDLLDAEIIAPDGELVVLPNGTLFVSDTAPDGRPAVAGAWWLFRPRQSPARLGRRYPVPRWEVALAASAGRESTDVVMEDVPCGLWVHLPPAVRVDDLAFSVPMRARNVLLLVSRPGEPGVPAAQVDQLVRALPDVLRDHLIVVPYGDQPLADGHLGRVAARAANQIVRVRTGLPLFVPGGGSRVVAVGSNGAPTWSPFARELLWAPDGGTRILKYNVPVPNLTAVAPSQFALDGRWLVEVVESGLWIRERDRTDGAGLVRLLPVDSQHCNIVLGVAGEHPNEPPWRPIARLLRKLPDDARSRIRLVVPEAAGDGMAYGAADALVGILDGRPVVLLAGDATVRPWRAAAYPSRRP